jgi:hypothetical protein
MEKTIDRIIDHHPQEVRKLLQEHGIKANPTARIVMDAAILFGDPFLIKIYELHDNEDSFLGGIFKKGKQAAAARAAGGGAAAGARAATSGDVKQDKKDKGKRWENFKAGFSKATGLVKSGTDTVNNAKNSVNELKDSLGLSKGTDSGSNNERSEDEDKDDTILGMGKGLFFTLLAVVVVIILALVIKRK